MLTLKMMSDEDLMDYHPGKGYLLVDLGQGSEILFNRGKDGQPVISVKNGDGEYNSFYPRGNTYVMQGGKTISTFHHFIQPPSLPTGNPGDAPK
ncbi:hypothetical protein [Pseudomonas hormoni]